MCATERVEQGRDTQVKVRGRRGDHGTYNADLMLDWRSAKKKGYKSLEDRWLNDDGNNPGNMSGIPWKMR